MSVGLTTHSSESRCLKTLKYMLVLCKKMKNYQKYLILKRTSWSS